MDEFLVEIRRLFCERFVAWSELEELKRRKMPEFLRGKNLRLLELRALLKFDFSLYAKYRELNEYLNHREKMNARFIKREQQKNYEIEGNRLDKFQIAAVVACEDAELILASAGSGKSASLLAKVNYLIRDLRIPAEEILVIAFTRKVVKELKERVKGSGVEICTFHSFGNKIIKNLKADLKLVPDGFLEKVTGEVFSNWEKSGFLIKEDVKKFGDDEAFLKLLIATLQLQKNEQISLKEFKERILTMKDEKERERGLVFFKYYAVMVRIYGKILREKGFYDFSDMLNFATRIIEKMPRGELKYQYVLVDEVQDLSRSKSLLLKAILSKCERAKLFAVGDDWQSIYRFAGSNLGVIKDFEKTFQRVTYRGVIRKTYRFGQPTAWVSEYFVRRNPEQSKKKVETLKRKKTPIEICLNAGGWSEGKVLADDGRGKMVGLVGKKVPVDYAGVDENLQKLYQKIGEALFEKRIQVISRYNRDLYRLVDFESKIFGNARIVEEKEDGVVLKWQIEKVGKEVEVAFCSMHKSKGITRDIVFVINMNEGDKGMPSTRADEPILSTMLAKSDKYPLAEERRLFYVAITRAKEKTFLIADKKKVSRFVREIAKNLGVEL
ncbi:MAG: UvrD-helicase domain-containing protein [Candidatus Saccharibacteria bacterium]|nr:UvrD-helicase domain-containing protein [Candidatus Saccharibacteria bacterium]